MASPPKFFKILLHRNFEHPKLMIPKMFVKDYGKLLSSSMILKLPDGAEWKVGLTTAGNGTVWLEKGWDKFAEHYCLEFGWLLVFKLLDGTGSWIFKVTIFNTTGVETQYSCNASDRTPDFESDSDESSESCRRHYSMKRKKTSLPCSCKKMRNEDSFSIKIEPEEEEECNIFSDIPSFKKRMPKEDEVEVSRRRQEFKNRAESTEKPGFKVVMSQSNVKGRFNMVIPKKFAKKYLSEEFGTISLQTENGKKWPLLYKWSRNRDEVDYISSGWRDFVQENHLKEGDVAFFELIKKNRLLFTKIQETVPSPKEKISPTRNPFFKVEIHKKSNSKSIAVLHIPMAFAKKHLTPEMYCAKLQVKNKEWNVTLKQYVNHARFSAGWSNFFHGNGLRDGDICFFEMVNKKNCIFKVTIFNK